MITEAVEREMKSNLVIEKRSVERRVRPREA